MEHRPDTETAIQASPSTTSLDDPDFSDGSSVTEFRDAEDIRPDKVNANSVKETVVIAHTTPIAAIADGLQADICM